MKVIYIKYKTLLILILSVVLLFILTFFYFHNKRTKDVFLNDDIYYQGNVDKKIMAFACNIDWGNEYIPDMLEIFQEYQIKISFFPTGSWAEKNPELLKEIYNRGHEIGNHGYFHKDYSLLSYKENKSEIEKADLIIADIIGTKPKYFAPPSGAYNDATIKAASDLGYKTIMWSIDTIDWRSDSTRDKIIKRVIDKSHNAAIVLMHPKEETVKALPIIIQKLRDKGYTIGTISDIIK